eukprot:UN03929
MMWLFFFEQYCQKYIFIRVINCYLYYTFPSLFINICFLL